MVSSVLPLAALLLTAPDGGALLARPVALTADRCVASVRERVVLCRGNARIVRDATVITSDEVEVHTLPGAGQLSGVGQDGIRRLVARGNVEASDGARWARGETADYDNLTGVLVVTGAPRARDGRREIEGETVTFETASDTLEVTRARTRIDDERRPGAESRIAIDADRLTLKSAESTALWRGRVRARRGQTLLRAPALVAIYDEGGGVRRVEASGGVEAIEGDRRARGQRGTFEAATGLLVLTGKPEAWQGKSHMRGTRMTFRSGSDRIEVENMVSTIDAAPGERR